MSTDGSALASSFVRDTVRRHSRRGTRLLRAVHAATADDHDHISDDHVSDDHDTDPDAGTDEARQHTRGHEPAAPSGDDAELALAHLQGSERLRLPVTAAGHLPAEHGL